MAKSNNKRTGKFLGVPYDWRKPTKSRFQSRIWSPYAPFINPRSYGWGYDFNFYAIIHPLKWRKARRKN